MMRLKHWQDAVNAVLGVWLILSPWAMGYQGETAAMSNAIIIGLALIAAARWERSSFHASGKSGPRACSGCG